MRRMSVRLVLSHLAVALVATAAAYFVVRGYAPMVFDQSLRMGGGPGIGAGQAPGQGAGQPGGLRTQVAAAVDQAVLVGAVVGAVAATLVGAFAAWRFTRPLEAVRDATRRIARGEYAATLPTPGTTELADLAGDVAQLGHTLQETEVRRVRLLGEVAHEMRTPLTVIEGTVEAMIDGVMPAGPDELAVVSGEVRRLRRLSDDLSALSKADEGRLALQLVAADLGEITRGVADRLRPQAADAGLALEVTADSVPAVVDPDRIAQVVTNLVGNAIRATPAGGRVAVTCRRDGDSAVLSVSDDGVGLAPHDLDRIFERFYRVDGARRDGGSGIGLTIARGIVAAHGGAIRATSQGLGRGAQLTVTLPVRGSAAADSAH